MKIKLIWPKCNFQNKQWTNESMDSYWVQCSLDEARNGIFPYLSSLQIEETMKNREQTTNGMDLLPEDQNAFYFLISKNLTSIESFPWHYPYSGQWNAYSPFKEIEEINISEIYEILNLSLRFV